MKQKFSLTKEVFLLLLLFGFGNLKAQFLNQEFTSGSAPTTIPNWSHSAMQYCPNGFITGEDAWIDMTGGGWGNGRYIEQTITTDACRYYTVSFDLGTWYQPLWDDCDAGVDVKINGVALGSRLWHHNMSSSSTNPLKWERMQTITFRGTGGATTIRFTCNASVITTVNGSGPGVVGFDDVEIDSSEVFQDSLQMVYQRTDCNTYCFSIESLMSNYSLSGKLTNILWYQNGSVDQTGGEEYCKKFPKNVPQTIKVTFTFEDRYGCFHELEYTVHLTATEDCGCFFDENVVLNATYVPCNKYQFSLDPVAGYTILCINWTVDGVSVGSDNPITLEFGVGTHSVCVNAIGHVDGEPDNTCCARRCTTIVVEEIQYEDIEREYCELADGYVFDPCAEFPGYNSFEIIIGGSTIHSGPCPSGAFTLAAGIYTLKLYDQYGCLVKEVTIEITTYPPTIKRCIKYVYLVQPCIFDEGLLNTYEPDCPECLNNISNVTPWQTMTDDITGETYYIKDYENESECKICRFEVRIICDDRPGGGDGKEGKGGKSIIKFDTKNVRPEERSPEGLKIVPNPSSSVFQIASIYGYEEYERVEIIDLTGKVILSKTGTDSKTYFDVSSYASGTYTVNVKTSTDTISLKLINIKK